MFYLDLYYWESFKIFQFQQYFYSMKLTRKKHDLLMFDQYHTSLLFNGFLGRIEPWSDVGICFKVQKCFTPFDSAQSPKDCQVG